MIYFLDFSLFLRNSCQSEKRKHGTVFLSTLSLPVQQGSVIEFHTCCPIKTEFAQELVGNSLDESTLVPGS